MGSEDELTKLKRGLLTLVPEEGRNLVEEAFDFARKAHEGQFRKTGEPFFYHPLRVAETVARLGLDAEAVSAALLHDAVEDTPVTLDEIEKRFGASVAQLVDGLTKETRIEKRLGAGSFYKMRDLLKLLVETTKDPRVLIIKLADRLDNVKSLGVFREDKRRRIAQETLLVFVPLAHRLGLWEIKRELEDEAFRYAFPHEYKRVSAFMKRKGKDVDTYLQKFVIPKVEKALKEHGLEATIKYRLKSLYSVWRKSVEKGIPLEDVYDVFGVRIIVPKERDCYAVLGILHELFTPVQGRVKDYIKQPKPNSYRSLHTTVIADKGKYVEFQIRTPEMDREAEVGIAAHWSYKEKKPPKDHEIFARLRELVQELRHCSNPGEFIEGLKKSLLPDEILVFTKDGDPVVLPKGSTPIDFAYRIHTELGNRCAGAKVNGRRVSLSYELNYGDKVEIITSPDARPSSEWLRFVRTIKAQREIKKFLKKEREKLYEEEGKKRLKHLCRLFRTDEEGVLEKLRKLRSFKDRKEACFLLGSNDELYRRLIEEAKRERKNRKEKSVQEHALKLEGLGEVSFRVAPCCLPVPGDEVVGLVVKEKGLVLHRRSCPNAKDFVKRYPERAVPVSWEPDGKLYETRLELEVRPGPAPLATVLSKFSSVEAKLTKVVPNRWATLVELKLKVKDARQLEKLKKSLNDLEEVVSLRRL
ncbi:MAG: bifunctional (p)ppGpp synthetase/guanosine-3',5'-bis(diphosphate) 3'-pyrophosphohydrolase [Aquificae bacterium]|nr:bifunctional (p)ppGpp synthetase/guanosine-3',5'-bis(diphosphate) 3'-pyrophosphohydrolase [Aquificota bacterium]